MAIFDKFAMGVLNSPLQETELLKQTTLNEPPAGK
jgi:hypothetical protein